LEKVQKRAHRIICHSDCTCHQFPLLSDRRLAAAIKHFRSATKNLDHVLHSLIPPASTIRMHRFIQPFVATSRRI